MAWYALVSSACRDHEKSHAPGRVSRTFLTAMFLGGAIELFPLDAGAAGPLAGNGQAITTSAYSIDLHQGSVVAGNRVMGLGGAYVALAEDVDGDLQNPAAPAVRPFFSIEEFDYWLGLGLTFPARLSKIDFFNSGSETGLRGSNADEPVFITPALNLQWRTLGLGFTAELQNYEFQNATASVVAPASSPASLEAVLSTFHVQLANSFFDGQLILGAGVRYVTMTLEAAPADGDTQTLFDTSGTGIELGAVWRPNLQPYRLGVAFRSAIDTQPSFSKSLLPTDMGDIIVVGSNGATLYLPERVSLPWDVNAGAAVQLGRRPLNPISRTVEHIAERATLTFRLRQLDREEERQRRLALAHTPSERLAIEVELAREERLDSERLDRAFDDARRALNASFAEVGHFYVLLSASVLVSGRVQDAVGVESFLDQVVNRSGSEVVFSPRLGAESEIWENRLKARAGAYLEPTRFATSEPRLHNTFGMDLRLFRWNVFGLWPDDFMWQVGGSVDVAQRYLTWGVSVAGWYPRQHRSELP
jgi:hypothetical protein